MMDVDLSRLIARATDEDATPAARNRTFGDLVTRYQTMACNAAGRTWPIHRPPRTPPRRRS